MLSVAELREQARKDGPRGRQVVECLPEIARCRTCLYVGANERRFQLRGLFRHCDVTVLEVHGPYCEQLRRSKRRGPLRVVQGDVRHVLSIPEVTDRAPYDIVVWWHGPEHVERVLARDALGRKLPRLARKAILVGAPWGRFEQEPIDGNEHQAHVSEWSPHVFESLGYRTATLGKPDARGHITAWRHARRPSGGLRA